MVSLFCHTPKEYGSQYHSGVCENSFQNCYYENMKLISYVYLLAENFNQFLSAFLILPGISLLQLSNAALLQLR